MKFMSILLREGRKEDLKKKYSDKYDEKTLDWILNISDLVDFNHKYTDFVLRTIDPETQDVEWWTDITIDELKLFDKYQNQLEKKDINQYENFYQLQSAIGPIQQREKEKELEKQVDKIYEDNRVLVVKPKTKQSSCKYGKGTRWCTAAIENNRFETYTSGLQDLYYIILKDASKELGYKIAVHFANSGNMSLWDDEDVKLSDRETALIMTQNRSVFNAILDDYKNKRVKGFDKVVTDAFDIVKDNYGNVGKMDDESYPPFKIYLILSGMNSLPDMGDHADAMVRIRYSYDTQTVDHSKVIDEYIVFITYKIKEDKLYLEVSLGNDEDPPIRDLGLSSISYNIILPYEPDFRKLRMQISVSILEKIYSSVIRDPRLAELMDELNSGGPKTWRYDRFSGYKFAENKGLVKKLVDWLDSGKSGTKLEFLS